MLRLSPDSLAEGRDETETGEGETERTAHRRPGILHYGIQTLLFRQWEIFESI